MERGKVQLFVPDASVAVKWFISEENSEKARELKTAYAKGSVNLVSPRLLEYETINALRFHPIVKLSREEIFVALATLRQLAIMADPPEGTWVKAVELSLSQGISVYDATYLALAYTSEGKMVTSDTRLPEKLSDEARKNIVLLTGLCLER